MATNATAGTKAQETRRGTGEADPLLKGLDELREFLQARRMKRTYGPVEFEAFEKRLHERVMGIERDVLAEELAAADVDAEAIVVEASRCAGCSEARRAT